MRRLNFLETVGLVAIVLPTAAVTAIGVLLATGTIRIYRESVEKEKQAVFSA